MVPRHPPPPAIPGAHHPALLMAARLREDREPCRLVEPVRWIRAFWSAWVPAAPDAANATRWATSASGRANPRDAAVVLFFDMGRFPPLVID